MASESGEIKTVLHVLPHPGGGGETYVDTLARMDGYRFERIYLSPSSEPRDALRALPRTFSGVLRSADLLHVHGEVAAGICLPALAVRHSVVTLHGLHLLRRSTGLQRRLAELNLRLVVQAATKTICVSEAERPEVLAAAGGGAAKRLVVIQNGVDPAKPPSAKERAAVRAELGLEPETVAGVYVGSLVDHKDPLTAVRAAIEVAREGSPLVLLVVGSGTLRPSLERLARDSNGAVRVLGHRSDVGRILGAADFFVLPSEREGLSYSLLEAMSIGLAPVVSDAPGNPETVGDAGIVVPRGDLDGLVAAYRRLLDEASRRALGEAARQRVEEQFRAGRMAGNTREIYNECLS